MTGQEFPLAWPNNWPRTKSPQNSRFQTTLPKSIKNVQESLALFASDSGHKVESVVVSSNVTLMAHNPKDSGVAVYFTWDGISTCIAVDRYLKVEENLQAIHHVIEAERTKLRHGGLNLVRAAFRGYAALPPPSRSKQPHEILGVRPDATPEEIEAAFREKAKVAHPDRAGGSAEAMQELNEARSRLRGGV